MLRCVAKSTRKCVIFHDRDAVLSSRQSADSGDSAIILLRCPAGGTAAVSPYPWRAPEEPAGKQSVPATVRVARRARTALMRCGLVFGALHAKKKLRAGGLPSQVPGAGQNRDSGQSVRISVRSKARPYAGPAVLSEAAATAPPKGVPLCSGTASGQPGRSKAPLCGAFPVSRPMPLQCR